MKLTNLSGTTGSTLITNQRANFGSAEGNKSGFYESNGNDSINVPYGSTWNHLIECRHSNPSNNYALQIGAAFFFQRLFFRCLNNNGNQSWQEIYHTGNSVEAWQTPSLAPTWGQPAPGLQPLRFRKNKAANSVEIVGYVLALSAISSGNSAALFTLPASHRPTLARRFTSSLGGSIVLITIDTQGNISLTPYTNVSTNVNIPIEISIPLL